MNVITKISWRKAITKPSNNSRNDLQHKQLCFHIRPHRVNFQYSYEQFPVVLGNIPESFSNKAKEIAQEVQNQKILWRSPANSITGGCKFPNCSNWLKTESAFIFLFSVCDSYQHKSQRIKQSAQQQLWVSSPPQICNLQVIRNQKCLMICF